MVNTIMSGYKKFFKQEKWLPNLLIGGVLCYIPILGWIVLWGYIFKILENQKMGETENLPEWNNFERKFFDGVAPFSLALVYSIISMILTKIIAVVLCVIGAPLALALSIILSLILPLVLISFSYRLMDLKSWQLALNMSAIIEDVQKGLKATGGFLVLFGIMTMLSVFAGCGLLAGFPVYVTVVVFYSILAEKFLALQDDVQEENIQENEQAAEEEQVDNVTENTEDNKSEDEEENTEDKEDVEDKKEE